MLNNSRHPETARFAIKGRLCIIRNCTLDIAQSGHPSWWGWQVYLWQTYVCSQDTHS